MDANARRDRIFAYVEGLPPEKRGVVVLLGLANAFVTLALLVGTAAGLAVSARRVWRRREGGWAWALRAGVNRPAAVSLLAGAAAQQAASRWAARELDRRAAATTLGQERAGGSSPGS